MSASSSHHAVVSGTKKDGRVHDGHDDKPDPKWALSTDGEDGPAPAPPSSPPPPYRQPAAPVAVGVLMPAAPAQPPAAHQPSTQSPSMQEPCTFSTLVDAYILTIGLGLFGGHWFYLGRPRWGLLYLCTAGLLGVGWAIDILRVPHLVHRAQTSFGDEPNGDADLGDLWVLTLCPLTGLVLGAPHWRLGRARWAAMHVLTVGFLGIGWALDILRMPCLVHDYNAAARLRRNAAALSGEDVETGPPRHSTLLASAKA